MSPIKLLAIDVRLGIPQGHPVALGSPQIGGFSFAVLRPCSQPVCGAGAAFRAAALLT
jgi:hypothetical protein